MLLVGSFSVRARLSAAFTEVAGLDEHMLARLKLSSDKLSSLSDGLRQIATSSKTTLGRTLRETKVQQNTWFIGLPSGRYQRG